MTLLLRTDHLWKALTHWAVAFTIVCNLFHVNNAVIATVFCLFSEIIFLPYTVSLLCISVLYRQFLSLQIILLNSAFCILMQEAEKVCIQSVEAASSDSAWCGEDEETFWGHAESCHCPYSRFLRNFYSELFTWFCRLYLAVHNASIIRCCKKPATSLNNSDNPESVLTNFDTDNCNIVST